LTSKVYNLTILKVEETVVSVKGGVDCRMFESYF